MARHMRHSPCLSARVAARATQAWPRAMPPSLGGAWRACSTTQALRFEPRHQQCASAARSGSSRRPAPRSRSAACVGGLLHPARQAVGQRVRGTARRRARHPVRRPACQQRVRVEHAVVTEAYQRAQIVCHGRIPWHGRPAPRAASAPGLRRRRRRARQQPGRGVEPAAEAGRRRAADALGQHRCAPRRQPAAPQSGISISSPRPMPASAAAAMRHGSRAAASPPGSANRRQVAQPLEAGPVDAQQFAAPGAAVAAQAEAVQRQAEQRAALAMLGGHRRDVGMVVLHRKGRQARAAAKSSAKRVLKKSGCRSCATACGRTSSTAHRWSAISTSASQLAALSRSPMCGDTKASSPRVMQTVFFSHAPVARTRRAGARQLDRSRRVAACAADELPARRRPSAARCRRSARRCRGRASAARRRCPCSRVKASLLSMHQRFAAGVRAGHHQQQRLFLLQPGGAGGPTGGFMEQQMVQRRARQHQAQHLQARRDAGQRIASVLAQRQQHDRPLAPLAAAPARRCRHRSRPAPSGRSAAITAKGFSSRCLRRRSSATAAALRASQASWKPPS